jgi:shikimate kinase
VNACVVLIGFKSSGKTTFGRLLSEASGRQFIDVDLLIEALYRERHGSARAVHEIYRDLGAETFRRFEREVVDALAGTQRAVISTTGATVLNPPNVPVLRRLGPLVLIDTPKETLRQRWLGGRLPQFLDAHDPLGSFERLYGERRGAYADAADAAVPTAGRSDAEVVGDILAAERRLYLKRHDP